VARRLGLRGPADADASVPGEGDGSTGVAAA